MSRMIDADALEREGWSMCRTFQKDRCTMVYEVKKPSDFPTIEERNTGKWIWGEDEYGKDGYHCDKCGFFIPWDYIHKLINYIDDYNYCPTNYCPNCGSDNRGE